MKTYQIFTNDKTDIIQAEYYLFDNMAGVVLFYCDKGLQLVGCYVLKNIVGFREVI